MKMKYQQTLMYSEYATEGVQNLTNITGKEAYEKYGLKPDECIRESVYFENGVEVEIKIVIPIDEESYTWTEAVMYDKNGKYLGCTEPGEDLFGEWHLEDPEGNEYLVKVEPYNSEYNKILNRMKENINK